MATRIVFIDFEASSLDANSFPVEVGWCGTDPSGPEGAIIQPHPSWVGRRWDDEAEALHRLTRQRIVTEGLTPGAAHAGAEAATRGAAVFSDAPAWDQHWYDELAYAALGKAGARGRRITVRPVEDLWGVIARRSGMSPADVMAVAGAVDAVMPVLHRAPIDASRLSAITLCLHDGAYRKALLGGT